MILQARAPPRAKRNQAEVGAAKFFVVFMFFDDNLWKIIGKSAKIPFLGEKKSWYSFKLCKFPCLCFWSVWTRTSISSQTPLRAATMNWSSSLKLELAYRNQTIQPREEDSWANQYLDLKSDLLVNPFHFFGIKKPVEIWHLKKPVQT